VEGASISRRSGRAHALAAFVARDFAIARSYRLPFILDGFYGVLNLAVYFFISRTFRGLAHGDLDAPSYFAFAAVGIVVATVIDTASGAIAYKIRDEQLAGTLEALLTQPLTAAQLCLGPIAFPALFALVRASLYLAVAAVWMQLDVSKTNWLGAVIMMLLTAIALAAFGVLAGAIVLVLKRGEILANMTLFGMATLSGSVFPVGELPDWLRWISAILPLRYGLDGVRHALFGSGGWGRDALILAAFGLIAMPIAVLIFARALAFSRRLGTVAQY
jgi:ABC-2 type transport system permease protein